MHEALTGWGRTTCTTADVLSVPGTEEIMTLLASSPPRGVLARGLGRSYGDAAQNAGGVVVSTAALNHLAWVDEEAGLLRVGAGMRLGTLIGIIVARGWFVPVSPGTSAVSIGGAIAADVHGKNHHVDGTFCSHVTALVLATPTGIREVTPASDPDLFWATAGGLGLTGIILEATLALLPVETSRMRITTTTARNLDEAMSRLTSGDDAHRYSVAWVDALARGRHMGRAVLSQGDHARRRDLPSGASSHPFALPAGRGPGPAFLPPGLLNRATVCTFNELWFRKASVPGTRLQSLGQFFHPLDGVGGWNRLYGRGGLIQYQFAVPFGAESVVAEVLQRAGDLRLPIFLAVLKRFGAGNPGPLSFPIPGWTLALDMPARADGLAGWLDAMDELVASAGGRVYLVKDARLRPELLRAMYPRLDAWKASRRRVDPEGVLRSDLARRLGLVDEGARP
jgi:decaprenylphospho-beta-D-ribofuranose 2-oxidase